MYRSLLYRNFLSKEDNVMALMKPAWQAQRGDGEGRKNRPLFPPHIPPFLSEPLLMFKAQRPN